MALKEIDGIQTPNPYGQTPFLENNPTRPNDAYFEHVDFVMEEAGKRGINITLLPIWGDKALKHNWSLPGMTPVTDMFISLYSRHLPINFPSNLPPREKKDTIGSIS